MKPKLDSRQAQQFEHTPPLDFGLPTDCLAVLANDWPDLHSKTIDDIDDLIELMVIKTSTLQILRRAAAEVIPGRRDIPFVELYRIVRKRQKQEGL